MILIEDSGNKVGKHKIKNQYWNEQGIEVIRYGLPVGDYVLVNDAMQEMLDRKEKRGIQPKKMDFLGTYKIAVDSKKDMQEVVGNICGQQHARFRDEIQLAANNGIMLYILIEDNGGHADKGRKIYNKPCSCIDDVFKWVNPRSCIFYKGKQKFPNATKGQQLAKAMITMEKKYGCKFVFCKSKDAGREILQLLNQ